MPEQFKVESDQFGKATRDTCEHLDQIKEPAEPKGEDEQKCEQCEQCVQEEQRWMALRLCLHCGFVGCDDESAGKHACKHAHDENHPVFRSLRPGDTWAWCYEDELLLEREDKVTDREPPDEETVEPPRGDINQEYLKNKEHGDGEGAGDKEAAGDAEKASSDDGAPDGDRPKPYPQGSARESDADEDRPKPS